MSSITVILWRIQENTFVLSSSAPVYSIPCHTSVCQITLCSMNAPYVRRCSTVCDLFWVIYYYSESEFLCEYFHQKCISNENSLQHVFNYRFMDKKCYPTHRNIIFAGSGIGLNGSQALCLIQNLTLISRDSISEGDTHWHWRFCPNWLTVILAYIHILPKDTDQGNRTSDILIRRHLVYTQTTAAHTACCILVGYCDHSNYPLYYLGN